MALNAESRIPHGFDYAALPCLSNEEVEKLTALQPATLKAASDIPGITPKALLYVYQGISGKKRQKDAGTPAAVAAEQSQRQPV